MNSFKISENITLEMLPVSALQIDTSYQRELNVKRVEKNIFFFEEIALLSKPLTVSLRADSTRWILDGQYGQYRQNMARRLGYEFLPAIVITGLSLADEARLFRLLNNVTKVNSKSLFNAAVVEGDSRALEIVGILKDEGFTYVNRGRRPKDSNCFPNPKTLQEVHDLNPKILRNTLIAIKACFPHESKRGIVKDAALVRFMLVGIAKYLHEHNGTVARVKNALKGKSVARILEELKGSDDAVIAPAHNGRRLCEYILSSRLRRKAA